MDIETAISKCIADLSLANHTARTYQTGLDRFIDFLTKEGIEKESPVETLSMEHFIYFLPWLDRSYSKQTAGVYGAASKSFLDWLVIAKYLEPTYLDTLRYKKSAIRSHRRHEDKLPRFPKKDEVGRMLYATKTMELDSPRKERNIALLELLASSGCRVNEITALNVRDFDFESRSTIVTGKGSKQRRVFFGEDAAKAIEAYWKARDSQKPTDPAFGRHDKGAGRKHIKRMTPTTARNVVKEVAVVAGIDPSSFSPHYFRHAFAIRVLSETGNLAITQDMLGHKDPKSTRVYAKIYSEDLQKAHRKIFGD